MANEGWISDWSPPPDDREDASHPDTSGLDVFRDFDLGGPDAVTDLGTPVGHVAPPVDGDEPIHSAFRGEPDEETSPSSSARPGRSKSPEVPGYEILGELGRGGMGVVYQARQLRLNRMVALKMILAGDHAGRDALERLLAEAETIARVKHPNIVQIYAIGDCGGRPYVELEFVEGGSLGSRLDGTPWSPRSAARLVEGVARAASEAHRLGIVHRDLKPANILITPEGEPKISDFGLAKSLDGDSGLTRTESILGSPSYMAPEQAEGRAKAVGPAADIYAIGVCLYELVTGRPPFVAPTILATLDLVKNSEPVRPRRLQPQLPLDLETICLKCLEKEPQRRYESAEALADDLEAFLGDEPIRVRRPPPWERTFRWVRRRPAAVALVVVCALALLSTAGVWTWHRSEVAGQAEAARRRDEALRAQARRFVVQGQDAVRREDWEAARAPLGSVLALVRSEPGLAGMRRVVEDLLARSDREIARRKGRESARARFARFQRLYDEAVFYQSDYTGMDPEANFRGGRASARGALAQFGLEPGGVRGGLDLDPAYFDAREVVRIVDGCYELALLLAEAESQPLEGEDRDRQARRALEILDGAERLRAPTPAYHLRRAGYLERLGEHAAAREQRRLAETASAPGRSSIDEFLAGQQAYRRNDLKGASAALQLALSLQPDHFWAQYLLAVCHLRARRPAEAQAALIACQGRRPRFVWTYLLKGFAEGEMGEFDLAEADFRRATELGLDDQEQYVLLVNRGVMRVRRGREAEAIDDLTAAIALKPDHYQAYINLAQACQNLGRRDDAVATLGRAIAIAPGQAVLFRARSQVERLRSRPEAALDDLTRAIELSAPDDPALAGDHLERGLLLQQVGRSREALADCDRAIELDPDRPGGHRLRGAILMGLKRYDEAVRSLDACLARGSAPRAIYEARGLARSCAGAHERAVADYTMALNVGRGSPSLYANRGWAYLLAGAPAPALRDFDDALRLDPSSGHALSGRAQANVQLRRPREAVDDARGSIRLGPGDPRQLYNATRVLCQAAVCLEGHPGRPGGDWAAAGRFRSEALEYLARAQELYPEAGRARFWDEVVRADSALEPIRRARRFVELDARVARRLLPSERSRHMTMAFRQHHPARGGVGGRREASRGRGAGRAAGRVAPRLERLEDRCVPSGTDPLAGASPSNPDVPGDEVPTVIADFDGNGVSDKAVADPALGTISLAQGQGDGTFSAGSTIVVGGRASGMLAADLNRDGRPDLAVSDALTGEVLVLRGLGDGTFQTPVRYRVGVAPGPLVVGDFDGNGLPDLAVADPASDTVVLLDGVGGGTFRPGPRLAVGSEPVALAAADFDGDGRTDLVAADRGSADLTFLWNRGGGVFQVAIWRGDAFTPSDVAAADFDGDGRTDLAVADRAGNRVLILIGLGGGAFAPPLSSGVGLGPGALVAGELDGSDDRKADLVVCDADSRELTVLRDWVGGTFSDRKTIALGERPRGIALGDLNGDNRADLFVADAESGAEDVYLGRGDGAFFSPASTVPLPHTPPLVFPTGDVINIDMDGKIILRLARPGSPGEFESPIVETADGTGNTARSFTALGTVRGPVVAILDWHRPLLIFALPKGTEAEVWYVPLPPDGIYTRLAAGDFDRDGRDDLVVLDRGSDRVLVFHQDAAGQFQREDAWIGVGSGPTDVTVADVNGDGWPDLLVANGASGDVSILHGGPGGRFGPETRLPGGLGPTGVVRLPDGSVRSSPDEPVGVTTGVFDASGLTDVVVVQRGTDRISLLKGEPGGGLADPGPSTTYPTGAEPTQAVAAALGRNGQLDLAVLNEGSQDLSIFMNDGRGGFITMPRVDAGNHPTGLAVRDVDGDGIADLLVGNDSGDLLVLLGNGDGTFRPYNRADRTVNLAVGDLNGDGRLDFVFSDESRDLLSVQYPGTAASFLQGRGNGLLAPGPVAIADLNRDGAPDLVVTNRGGNDVVVYLGLSRGQFAAPLRFFTGTAPVGLTIADLDGDGSPDLVVANEGSNDVSVLLGRGRGSDWTLDPGPRLRVGARPVSTTVVDVDGDGIKDIICVNQDGNSAMLLRGLGGGFFDDRAPRSFPTGQAPIQAFFGRFGASREPGLVVLNSLSSSLTCYPSLRPGDAAPLTITTGGLAPVAGIMGDFNKDGFSDFVIANGGNARLAMFLGGPRGLVLANTISLEGSPTI